MRSLPLHSMLLAGLLLAAPAAAFAQAEDEDHHPDEAEAAPQTAPGDAPAAMPGTAEMMEMMPPEMMEMMTPEMMEMMGMMPPEMMGMMGMMPPGMMAMMTPEMMQAMMQGMMDSRGSADDTPGMATAPGAMGPMGRMMMGQMMMGAMMETMTGMQPDPAMYAMMAAQGLLYGTPHGETEEMTPDRVRAFLEQQLARHGNPRLALGEIAVADDGGILAEIVTVDGSLVQKLAFNRYPGLFRQLP